MSCPDRYFFPLSFLTNRWRPASSFSLSGGTQQKKKYGEPTEQDLELSIAMMSKSEDAIWLQSANLLDLNLLYRLIPAGGSRGSAY